MFLGTSIYALAAFGYIADYLANELLMQVALGGQVLLLTYAVVLRVRFLIERLLRMETRAKEKLEREVNERTRQLQHAMGELESANAELARLSTRDKLTDLHNRRYFDDALENCFQDTRRLNYPLSLVLFDADHFKAINDVYGHGFGDDCLRHIASQLQESVHRPRDTIARFGGEEFVLLLPNTDLEGAIFVAHNVLCEIREQTIIAPDGSPVALTLSAGVATLLPEDADGFAMFKRADIALYEAKHNGRDRVCAQSRKEMVSKSD